MKVRHKSSGVIREAMQFTAKDIEVNHQSDCSVHNEPAMPKGPRVRAKFVVVAKVEDPIQKIVDITMHPVYSVYSESPDTENNRLWQMTPAGCIQLCCCNLLASERFETGREFYVDFTPAG